MDASALAAAGDHAAVGGLGEGLDEQIRTIVILIGYITICESNQTLLPD